VKHSASALIAAAKRDNPRASLEGDVLGALGAATVALAPSFGAKLWLALKHAAVSKVGIATIAFTAATGGYAAGRLQERAIHESTIAPTPTQTQTLARTLTQTQTPTPTPTPTPTQTPTLMQTPAPALTQTQIVAASETATTVVQVAERVNANTTGTPFTVTSTSTATTTDVDTPPPPPQTASLADEVAAIKRARTALLDKNARNALAALDDYERAHPSGAMSEEALALRVRADRLAGDDVAAAEALTKLEQRFPTSIQLAALRR
jgi:hypothetical protein